jgi:iron(III) transport system substrate-binding protein
VNVSGGGVTAAADNPAGAVRLLEFLAGAEAQEAFSEANYEYPVNPDVEPAEILREWGEFRADTVNLERLGELNGEAVRVFDEVGWQ